MNTRSEKKGYQIVVDSGKVSREEAERLFKESEAGNETFTQLLVKQGLMEEKDLLKLYSKEMGIPFVALKDAKVAKSTFDKIPVKFAWYYRFFPYALDGQKLTIAVSRPVDVNFVDEVRFGLRMEVDVVFARDREIEEMLQKHYGLAAETLEKILTQQSGAKGKDGEPSHHLATDVEDLEKMADNASVIQLVNQILLDALKKGASDIHLEPFRGKIRLRYRIDGVLREAPVPPEMKTFFPSMISRIKIMANLNIVEKRLPQDGKARVKTQDQTLDLRVSSIPTPHGESLVIRLLPGQMIKELKDLGLEPEQLAAFRELLERPHGIVFVTGPTGSGKSTTLYAGMSSINKEEHKVITIEDPVEYELEGVTQIQVLPSVGLTFAMGLRSILRHDPDIMMVGEVRDLETADIAIRVALTGHLILSTLHTNDAASGVTRLLDIGIEPYLAASSVIGFIAQRLVRVICPHCKAVDKEVLDEIRKMVREELGLKQDCVFYRGKGCDHCHGSGYSGRIAIYEFLMVSENVRRLIFERASAETIKTRARLEGMKTLRQNGWRKALAGITTAEEVMQVSPSDERMGSSPAPSRIAVAPPLGPLPSRDKEKNISDTFNNEDPLEFINRRAYSRVKAELPIKYRTINLDREDLKNEPEDGEFLKAVSDDVSANGVCFTIAAEVLPGTALDLRIRLPGQNEDIQCISRVVRVLKTLDSMGPSANFIYQVGATFLAINSTDRLKLEKFCKEQAAA
jgi:type II secretory ATPase GspE/PulE/Tfp pilus assembly ATPase PilB-like protein